MNKRLHLLQYYKVVVNFATQTISAFIPLIVLQYTGKLYIALLYWALERLVRVGGDYVLRNFVRKKPQLALILRMIPLVISYFFIIYINASNALIFGLIIEITMGINYALGIVPQDILYNYVSVGKSARTMGVTNMLDRLSMVLAQFMGGFFLDYIDKTVIIVMSMIVYFISILPMAIDYFKNFKKKNYNKEYTSNASLYYSKQKDTKDEYSKVKSSVMRGYTILHILVSASDNIITILNLYLFSKNQSFFTSGINSSLFQLTFGIFAYIWGQYGKKHNPSAVITVSSILLGIIVTFLPYTTNAILLAVFCSFIGICYASLYTLIYQQQLEKTRILGCSNKLVYMREYGRLGSQTAVSLFGILGTMLPCFFVITICHISAGIYYNINEEHCRKKIVDFIHQNDIR